MTPDHVNPEAPWPHLQQLADATAQAGQRLQWIAAASQGAEAHLFLIEPRQFVTGERDSRLSSDDCGTTQHYLLLDEFYRTALWLAAVRPPQREEESVWFDRKQRAAHVYPHTRTSKDTPQTLVAYLDADVARFADAG